jgi:putative sigma-54 modulation protein
MVGESTSEFEIIRTNENLVSKPITLEEALNYLNDKQRIFVVFRNAGNERVCVLFRREDGNFGLIEP